MRVIFSEADIELFNTFGRQGVTARELNAVFAELATALEEVPMIRYKRPNWFVRWLTWATFDEAVRDKPIWWGKRLARKIFPPKFEIVSE